MIAPLSIAGAERRMGAVVAINRGSSARDRIQQLGRSELERSYRLAGLILGNESEAEDATQEAILRAWRSSDSLREVAGFDAWFDRILINECRDRLRRRKRIRFVAIEEAEGIAKGDDGFRPIRDRDLVLSAMTQLSDDERLVILLHYWADLTAEGVAARLGWPIGTVKSRLNRALVGLRGQLLRSEASDD